MSLSILYKKCVFLLFEFGWIAWLFLAMQMQPFHFWHISSSICRKAMRFKIITGTKSLTNNVTLRKGLFQIHLLSSVIMAFQKGRWRLVDEKTQDKTLAFISSFINIHWEIIKIFYTYIHRCIYTYTHTYTCIHIQIHHTYL